MTKFSYCLTALFICSGCSHAPVAGDRRLKKNEIPEFLKEYKTEKYQYAEFYEKGLYKNKSFEVKYLENEREISLAFDKTGKLIEREEDIKLEDLDHEVRKKIMGHLDETYPGYVILELEKRQENQTENFIDIEIRHKSSESGYWELSFLPDGTYVSREVENYQTFETLN